MLLGCISTEIYMWASKDSWQPYYEYRPPHTIKPSLPHCSLLSAFESTLPPLLRERPLSIMSNPDSPENGCEYHGSDKTEEKIYKI